TGRIGPLQIVEGDDERLAPAQREPRAADRDDETELIAGIAAGGLAAIRFEELRRQPHAARGFDGVAEWRAVRRLAVDDRRAQKIEEQLIRREPRAAIV